MSHWRVDIINSLSETSLLVSFSLSLLVFRPAQILIPMWTGDPPRTAQTCFDPPFILASFTPIGCRSLKRTLKFTIKGKPGSSANAVAHQYAAG